MNAINDLANRVGGTWVKLDEEGKVISGYIISTEMVDRTTPEGDVVKSKRGNVRQVMRMRLATDERDADIEDDQGVRIFDANETAQREIVRAYRESKLTDDVGAHFAIKCTKVTGTYEQNEVRAKFGQIDRSKVEQFLESSGSDPYGDASYDDLDSF